GEVARVDVDGRDVEARERGVGRELLGGREEREIEGGGLGPEALSRGALQGAGAELVEGAEGGPLLSEALEGLGDEGEGEDGVLLGEGDEERAESGEGKADEVVVTEGRKSAARCGE